MMLESVKAVVKVVQWIW